MAIGPKGPPQKPGLSIRGRVIFDTVRGVPRVRPWPPKKPTKPGTKRNLTAKAFGAANRACKITASVFYGEHWEATRGTPLLPRDMMIAFMYGRAFAATLDDGRILRSMASRNDVSTSLDMIGQTEGSTLVRGPKYWEQRPVASPIADTAMLWLDPQITGGNFSTRDVIPFNNASETIPGAVDLAADPSKIWVPPGINFVRATANFDAENVSSGIACDLIVFRDGSANWNGCPIARWSNGQPLAAANLSSPIFSVTPGEAFQLALRTPGDTSITLFQYRCWLQLEFWK